MTSEPDRAFVWIWLPGAAEAVVCGRLDDRGATVTFGYATSYLARADALPLYGPELPLREGAQHSLSGNRLPLCIDDAMPDAWGRRLVHHRLGELMADFGELTHLLHSGSDRIGALDFQERSDEYVPRSIDAVSLDELADASWRLMAGLDLSEQLTDALLRGTSIGGARPKALVDGEGRRLIAKFSSTTDLYPVVQAEFVAMELARRAGLDVAPVELVEAAGKHALLVDRFDRAPGGARHRIVSALTVLGLNPFPEGRYATYALLADEIRAHFDRPTETLRELFGRIVFNILCSNTDDHGRNHAAFVLDGTLGLTPAYDICPQARSGEVATQAMAYGPNGERESNVWALHRAAAQYGLDSTEARDLIDAQIAVIEDHWQEVADLAGLATSDRDRLRGHQFLNPGALRS